MKPIELHITQVSLLLLTHVWAALWLETRELEHKLSYAEQHDSLTADESASLEALRGALEDAEDDLRETGATVLDGVALWDDGSTAQLSITAVLVVRPHFIFFKKV